MSQEYPVELPSCGYLNTDDVLKTGVLHVKPMTVAEEALMGSQREEDRIKLIDTIVQRCVSEKFPIEDMLISDKLYTLFVIRQVSYGPNYSETVKCDSCAFRFKHDIKFFESFKVIKLEKTDVEPFKVVLDNGDSVSFRMLRVGDERDILNFTRSILKRGGTAEDPAYWYRLAKHIVAINGKDVTVDEASKYVRPLDGGNSSILRDAIRDRESGVDIEYEVSCPQCGNVMERMLQFTAEFFRKRRTDR